MKTDIRKQDIDVTWQNLNPGTVVTGGATAPEFNTGEWRVNVPVLDMDKCKQCLMCVPVCPDSSIPVKNEKREDFYLDVLYRLYSLKGLLHQIHYLI